MQTLRCRLGGALGQERVDPLRRLERGAQPRPGRHVQHEGSVARVEVGIEQDRVAPERHAEMSSQVDGQRRCANSTSNTGEDHEPAAWTSPPGVLPSQQAATWRAILSRGHRLWQIVVAPSPRVILR